MWRGVEVDSRASYKRCSETPGDTDEEETECPVQDGGSWRVVFGKR